MSRSRTCHAVTHGDVTPVVTVPRSSVPPTRPDPTHNYYWSSSLAYLPCFGAGSLASATAALGSQVECKSEIRGWVG